MPVQTKTVRRSVRPKGATFGSALAGSAATTVETVGKDGRKSQVLLLICFERTPKRLCLKFFQSVLTPISISLLRLFHKHRKRQTDSASSCYLGSGSFIM